MRDSILFILLAPILLTCSSNIVYAEDSLNKSLNASRTHSPVHLDGRLREPSWETAAPATGFTQRELIEGAPATEKTELKILYDEDNVYIGIICYDSEPSGIIRNEMDRDVELISDDSFTLVLDTFDAKRSGYFFEINPNGARYDGFFYGTELKNEDWDGVWDASAVVDDYGWSAEIKIPFKTLRFPNRDIQAWGINFRRIIRRKNEEVLWCSWKRDDGLYQLMKAGKLHGIRQISKGRHVEFEPYVLGGLDDDDGKRGSDFKAGGDITYPIASDLTLDITTFTDFAQVETDKARINLTRFSLFYPEKRDFFLESAEIFDFDTGYFEKVFHSRRIGISPDREQVPVLGGVNLSGRIGSYSLGFQNIQTDSQGIHPEANNTVVRIKKDILERSRIGFMATNLYDSGKHANTTVGADFFYQTNKLFGRRNFGIRGDVTGSFTDGDHNDNMFGRMFIDYPNDLIDSFWELYHVGEGFNPELGFITRKGIQRVNGAIRYYPRPQIFGVNKLIFKPLGVDYKADLGGNLLERKLSFWPAGILTTSDDLIRLEVDDYYDYVDSTFAIIENKIKIPAGIYRWTDYGVFIQTSRSRPIALELKIRTGTFYHGDHNNLAAECTYKLNRHVSIAADADYNSIKLGDDKFIARDYGGRIRLNLSTKLTTNTFVQWNNETDEVNLNIRIHYLPNAGSDVYFVYNHLWDESADFKTRYRTGILKVSYLFRF